MHSDPKVLFGIVFYICQKFLPILNVSSRVSFILYKRRIRPKSSLDGPGFRTNYN